MPVVQIHVLKGHSLGEKRRLVKAITDAVVGTLKLPKEWVQIIISEMAHDHNAIGGNLIRDIEGKTKKKRRKAN
jgi:4-oxalocrotonate tautomerase